MYPSTLSKISVSFHQKRIQSLDGLKLAQVLKRKNPYLFKAKYVLTAEQIVKGLVDVLCFNGSRTASLDG